MTTGKHRLSIPSNPEYSVGQLRFMIREVEVMLGHTIGLDDWGKLS
jgi:hypothetical protein